MFIKFSIDEPMQFINLDYVEYIEVRPDCGTIKCYGKEPEIIDDDHEMRQEVIYDEHCGSNPMGAANALYAAIQRGDHAFDITKYYDAIPELEEE